MYRAQTWLLPRVLMRQHGSELVADARAEFERAHAHRGLSGLVGALLGASADLMARAPGEWWSEREEYASYDATRVESVHPGERVMRFGNDVKLAARALAKRPGFAFVAVLTLALGVGANVAIFTVVNAVLLQPLPYEESEQLVFITHAAPGLNFPDMRNSPGTYRLYVEQTRSYQSMAAVSGAQRNLTGSTRPARINAARVTPSLHDVLRVEPVIGRRLTDEDAAPGAPPVALLTHVGWSAQFGSAPDVVGRVIELDGVATEIVGVMGRDFVYPNASTALLLPYGMAPGEFGTFGMTVIARLRPGTSIASAHAEVQQVLPRMLEMFPGMPPDFFEHTQMSASVESLRDRTVHRAETTLWIVLGTVVFLLLVACASVANLFLVRSESRTREVAIRLALGAPRSRVASIFLAESLLLSVVGGAWGLLLGYLGVRALVAAAPAQLPRLHEISVGVEVVLFAALVSILAGVAFGTLALLGQLRATAYGVAREGRAQTAGRERQRVRKVLIAVQIALALMLVTGSALMLRSFDRLRAVDPGVEADGVLAVGVSRGSNVDRARALQDYMRIVEAVRTLPGVSSAGVINALPINPGGMSGTSFAVEGRTEDPSGVPWFVMYSSVTEDALPAFGIDVIAGRSIERADVEQARPVAVVTETFARNFFEGDAIGQRIRFDEGEPWIEIIGMVPDVRSFGLREAPRPLMYVPLTAPVGGVGLDVMYLGVRTTGDPMRLAPEVRAAVQRIDSEIPIMTAQTMRSIVDAELTDTSMTMTVLLVAAVVALLLGAVGLYGVIGFVVAQRRSEIGVRIALGAMPQQVRRMILAQGLGVAVLGVIIGLAGAIALGRLLESVLFEVSARDPLTLIVAPIVLLGVSALAAYLPARRASEVSPLEALRST